MKRNVLAAGAALCLALWAASGARGESEGEAGEKGAKEPPSSPEVAPAPDNGTEEKAGTPVKPAPGAADDPALEPAAPLEAPAGESGSVVQVSSLVYSKTMSSVCFSDHFLRKAEETSRVSTSRRFHSTKLDSADVFKHPFAIMTGEGAFSLPEEERKNLGEYLKAGGFLLASAGCSSEDWDRSFRAEIAKVLPGSELKTLAMEHPVFHTVTDIAKLDGKHREAKPLEGIEIEGRLAVIYSCEGLNDTGNVTGCCCCGGNEIRNAEEINVNILVYALTH